MCGARSDFAIMALSRCSLCVVTSFKSPTAGICPAAKRTAFGCSHSRDASRFVHFVAERVGSRNFWGALRQFMQNDGLLGSQFGRELKR